MNVTFQHNHITPPAKCDAGKFVGGGDETAAAAQNGTLKEKLSAAGVA